MSGKITEAAAHRVSGGHDAPSSRAAAPAGERALYLLDYGEDLVVRLAELAPSVALSLEATLRYLRANLPLLLRSGIPDRLAHLAEDLDVLFAPGEWLLREVEQ